MHIGNVCYRFQTLRRQVMRLSVNTHKLRFLDVMFCQPHTGLFVSA